MDAPRIFRTPGDVVWGRGSLSYLENIRGRRALIVTDKSMSGLGVVDRARSYLEKAGLEIRVFDGVEPEPSSDTVKKIVLEYADFSPDVIVGLGGGSAIDASKGFRIFYEHPQLDFEEVMSPGVSPVSLQGFKKTIHVCISSTSGTGSDASYACVITHSGLGVKVPILHQDCIPDIAICDPDISDSMPDKVLLDSGLDALTHAVESYINDRTNDFSKGLSLQSFSLVMQFFPKSYLQKDPVAMEHMYYAATMAGMGFSNSANGIAHTIADKADPPFKLTHGLACGIALLYTIKYNSTVAGDLLATLARAIGYNGDKEDKGVDYLMDRFIGLYKKLGAPTSFKDAGVPEGSYSEKMAEFVERSINFRPTLVNPRKSNKKDLEALYRACYDGDYSKL